MQEEMAEKNLKQEQVEMKIETVIPNEVQDQNPAPQIKVEESGGEEERILEAYERAQEEERQQEEQSDGDEQLLKIEGEEGKKKKKRKQKKKKKTDEDPPTDYECDWKSKVKDSKILDDPNLPPEIKQKYALLENNPLAMVVSGIPKNIPLKGLEEYFNTLIINLNQKVPDRKPVKNIEFGVLKNWVILELTCKEAKQTLSPLDTLEYSIGCKIKVEKPKKFLDRILNATTELMTQEVQKHEQIRLYLGSLPLFLNDDDVKKLISTFGPLSYFNLVKDNSNQQQPVSKGYCFFEYEHVSSAYKALKALNGLQIADKRLKINRVAIQQKVNRSDREPSNHAGSFLASCELLRIPEVQMMLTVPQSASIPSKVVQFLNMVSLEDLFDDELYQELQKDLESECEQFGKIDKIEIPRPDKDTGYCCPAVGKCFVKFVYQIPAKKCKNHLAGRTYNKRTVITSFYPEEKFDLKDYLING